MQTFVSNLRPAEIVGALPSAPSKDWPMRASVDDQGLDADWTKVSGATPCPVCGGLDECRTHVEEAFACCVAQPSEWRLSNGGWLHRIEPASGTRSAGLARVTEEQGMGDASAGVVS